MAAIEVKTNGYTADTAKHYLLDAGALFKNITFDGVGEKYTGEPLGATVGGSKLNIKVGIRQPEVDGVLVKVKGNDVIESVEATLEGTFKEWRTDNIAAALFADVTTGDGVTAPADYKIIKGHNTILSTDYVTNIGYVGKITGEAKPVIILLKNSLNTEGLSFDTKDKEEAGIPFKFEARADADKPEDYNGIWEIIYPVAVV